MLRAAHVFDPLHLVCVDLKHRIGRPGIAARHPRVGQANSAFAADDQRVVLHLAADGDGALRSDAGGEMQQGIRLFIDLAVTEMTNGAKGVRIGEIPVLCAAGNEAGKQYGVVTDIENGASSLCPVEKTGCRIEACFETDRGLSVPDIADLAGASDLQHPLDLRMTAIHQAFHEEDSLLRRGLGHCRDLRRGDCGRLLARTCLPACIAMMASSAWAGCCVAT